MGQCCNSCTRRLGLRAGPERSILPLPLRLLPAPAQGKKSAKMKLGDSLQMYYHEEVSPMPPPCVDAVPWLNTTHEEHPTLVFSTFFLLLQLKCWLMPGEEDAKRAEIEGAKLNAAPPTAAAVPGASARGTGGLSGGANGGLLGKRGVAGRYASTGGFGEAPDGSTSSSTGTSGGVLGGLRPAGFGAGAPAMFRPPPTAFVPAAPAPEAADAGEQLPPEQAGIADTEPAVPPPVAAVPGASAAGSRAGSQTSTPTRARAAAVVARRGLSSTAFGSFLPAPVEEVAARGDGIGGGGAAGVVPPPAAAAALEEQGSLDVGAVQAGWGLSSSSATAAGRGGDEGGYELSYQQQSYGAQQGGYGAADSQYESQYHMQYHDSVGNEVEYSQQYHQELHYPPQLPIEQQQLGWEAGAGAAGSPSEGTQLPGAEPTQPAAVPLHGGHHHQQEQEGRGPSEVYDSFAEPHPGASSSGGRAATAPPAVAAGDAAAGMDSGAVAALLGDPVFREVGSGGRGCVGRRWGGVVGDLRGARGLHSTGSWAHTAALLCAGMAAWMGPTVRAAVLLQQRHQH